MRVLVDRSNHPIHQAACASCSSLLEVEPSDLTFHRARHDDKGDHLAGYTFMCPICSFENWAYEAWWAGQVMPLAMRSKALEAAEKV